MLKTNTQDKNQPKPVFLKTDYKVAMELIINWP